MAKHRSKKLSRRQLLAGAAAALAGPASGLGQSTTNPTRPPVPEDPTKLQGPPPTELGERSPFERPRRWIGNLGVSGSSSTPLEDLQGIITPADLHFERHHAGIPAIDPERYRLLIHGMVDRPTTFSLADLKRFPAVSRLYFVECSGNGYRAYRDIKPDLTPQAIDGLTSTSEWTGVPLAILFREVGIKEGAEWFLAEGQDAAVMTRSIPMRKAGDDALLAYGQNGEALRPEQGYPVRLLLPGWEGNASVKWLRRLEVAAQPFMTREETSKYSDPLPDCTARLFSFEMDAKSLITFPAFPMTLRESGWWEITGLAWSGRGKIGRVEVSVDGGRRWEAARLDEPVLPKCHTRFRFLWNWSGGAALLMSRAVDETGYVQPTLEQLRAARGAGTHYHQNNIRAWRVRRDGKVVLELA